MFKGEFLMHVQLEGKCMLCWEIGTVSLTSHTQCSATQRKAFCKISTQRMQCIVHM